MRTLRLYGLIFKGNSLIMREKKEATFPFFPPLNPGRWNKTIRRDLQILSCFTLNQGGSQSSKSF